MQRMNSESSAQRRQGWLLVGLGGGVGGWKVLGLPQWLLPTFRGGGDHTAGRLQSSSVRLIPGAGTMYGLAGSWGLCGPWSFRALGAVRFSVGTSP